MCDLSRRCNKPTESVVRSVLLEAWIEPLPLSLIFVWCLALSLFSDSLRISDLGLGLSLGLGCVGLRGLRLSAIIQHFCIAYYSLDGFCSLHDEVSRHYYSARNPIVT
jgi:hypothetical protein